MAPLREVFIDFQRRITVHTSHSIHNLKLKGLQDDVANHFGIQHAQEHVVRIVLCRERQAITPPSQGRLGFEHPKMNNKGTKKKRCRGRTGQERTIHDNTV